MLQKKNQDGSPPIWLCSQDPDPSQPGLPWLQLLVRSEQHWLLPTSTTDAKNALCAQFLYIHDKYHAIIEHYFIYCSSIMMTIKKTISFLLLL